MTIKEALIKHLLSRHEVANLVSDRVRPNKAKQGETLPYLVVRQIQSDPQYHAGGESGLTLSVLRLLCYGSTETAAANLSDVVRQQVSGRPSGFVETMWIKSIMVSNISDASLPPTAGDEVGYPCVFLDLDIWHQVEVNTVW